MEGTCMIKQPQERVKRSPWNSLQMVSGKVLQQRVDTGLKQILTVSWKHDLLTLVDVTNYLLLPIQLFNMFFSSLLLWEIYTTDLVLELQGWFGIKGKQASSVPSVKVKFQVLHVNCTACSSFKISKAWILIMEKLKYKPLLSVRFRVKNGVSSGT